MRIGLLALARPTFDLGLAEEKLAGMLARLDATGHEILGSRGLLMDAAANRAALEALRAGAPDLVLVAQVTFTDAGFVAEVAGAVEAPLAIWAPREPRAGGRLRLNAFCGLNLASHALGLRRRAFGWLYADPDAPGIEADLAALLAGARAVAPIEGASAAAEPLPEPILDGLRIARIGAAPDGFDTCRYDAAEVARRFGAEVEELELAELFETARAADPAPVAALRAAIAAGLAGVDALDQAELDRSLRLKLALDQIRARRDLDAFAIRCWPEAFTEYGGAVCGPVAMQGEARVPCACEADVWGALSQLALQRIADAPVFLVDLVDLDPEDDSAVVWHCGQAPRSMAGTAARATIHTNRRMPLLYEFPLRPGRVTFLRLSQARGVPKLVLATGEMLERPMAFTGTSGTLRFDAPARAVLSRVIDSGLEHHMALAYGDHAAALARLATSFDLPVINLVEQA
ncbi:MAG: hypothetical protein KDJ83_01120 [Rhodobacteraceae bacterium]|nr:hypothetical protein [Paracoccaceae bacterium]